MFTEAHVIIATISVGAWLIGLGFGVLFGVRLPHGAVAWRDGSGLAVVGAFVVGLILFLGAIVAQRFH